jgi:hypothetical protein
MRWTNNVPAPPQFSVRLQHASDSQAEVEVLGPGTTPVLGLSGEVYGPKCEFARTLPTKYPVTGSKILIPEPCYWTPQLPFLYELELRWQDAEGGDHSFKRLVGLRRLSPRRNSLYWDSRRVVLRGMRVPMVTADLIAAARAADVTLLTPPTDEQCALADRFGTPLIADLRDADSTADHLARLVEHPSVAMVLVNDRQLFPSEIEQLPLGGIYAVAVDAPCATPLAPWSNVIVVELQPGDRPHAALAHCAKPVIAIRRGESYADFAAARAACDRLQTELSPEFNLAGYFVAE